MHTLHRHLTRLALLTLLAATSCDAPIASPPRPDDPTLHARGADLESLEQPDAEDDGGATMHRLPHPSPPRTPPPEFWRLRRHTLEHMGCRLVERAATIMLPASMQCGAQQWVLRSCSRVTTDPVALAKALHRVPSWRERGVDRVTLPRLLKARGFVPPTGFRALVVEITFDPSRDYIQQERAFEVGDSSQTTDWNPASTIKLYSAIGALRRLNTLGFSSRARLALDTPTQPRTTLRELVRQAIVDSDNIAHNRLVQLADFETLNLELLGPRFGLTHSFINRPYDRPRWIDLGEGPSLRNAPRILLKEDRHEAALPSSETLLKLPCRRAACTSLRDLAETMRRLMLQEQLPACETFDLNNSDLRYLRRMLRAPRARGDRVVNALRRAFNFASDIRFYHKPGYSDRWYSDTVYIYIPGHRQTWVVAMTAREGRKGLDDAAHHLGEVLASGTLHRQPSQHPDADRGGQR